ncbi:MAG: DUF7504 family protein [Halobacteriota archaeon]
MTEPERFIDVEPRRQAIVMVSAMDDPLDLLPPEAYDNLVVVSTRGHPEEIERRVERHDADPSDVYVIPVSGSGVSYDGELNVAERAGPTNLTKIGVTFSNAVDQADDEPWVLFDNFNIMLMYTDEKRVYRFMDTMTGNVRGAGGRGAYCTVRDAIDDQTYEKFRQLCDVEIDAR